MKTFKSSKSTKAMLVALVLLVSLLSAFDYPPNNAAVLYYKASMLYEVDDEMNDMLSDLRKGRIELNDKIKEFVNKNHRLLTIVLDASEIEFCDWGFDFSQGLNVLFPRFGKLKQLTWLILADARILAEQGDYETALSRCISIYKIARHMNERPVICYLVGISLNAVANNCVIEILSDMPQDMETLTWLKDQLNQMDKRPISIKLALYYKREAGITSMNPQKISNAISGLDDGACKEDLLERISSADEKFFERNIKYWNNYMDSAEAAIGLPYSEAYSTLKSLDENLVKDLGENPDLALAAVYAPAWWKIYSLSIRMASHYNAVKTAIEIYMIKAKTGKLPDKLPEGLPKDLFSGKDFQYEKTSEGFILRCQGKDLVKDEIHEYEFKVQK